MKFTLKNLLLLNSVFLSMFTFDLDCMNDSDSAPKIKRLDSMMELPGYEDSNFPRLTLDNYLLFAAKFFEAAGKGKGKADKIKKCYEKIYPAFNRLKKNFGLKPYAVFLAPHFSYAFERIKSIDPSILTEKTWNDIKNWIDLAKENEDYKGDFENLEEDLQGVMKILHKKNFELEEKTIEGIYQKIAGPGKLFFVYNNIDNESKEIFKNKLIKLLKSSRENFKRIMLLYFVSNMGIYIKEEKIPELPEYLKNLENNFISVNKPALKAIDISFPNLMNFAVKFTKKNYKNLCENTKDPYILKKNESWDLGHVLFIYEKFKDKINRIITGKGLNGISDAQSGLEKKEIEDLVEAIVGIDLKEYEKLKNDKAIDEDDLKKLASSKLFNVSELDDKDLKVFKDSLKEILENATGFQLVLSLITADTINRCNMGTFHKKNSQPISIRIKYQDERKCSTVPEESESIVKISRSEKMYTEIWNKAYATFHELIHVYHHMINFLIRDSSIAIVFSILNNPLFDAGDRFFPIFSKQAKFVIRHIVIEDDGELIVSKDEIIAIAEKAISYGFGNILFGTISDLNKDKLQEYEINIERLMKNKEFVQTCLYLKEEVLPADEEEYDARWNNGEEMLTMQGYVPILKDGVSYIVEDRQNDQIYAIRSLMHKGKHDLKQIEKDTYRFHNNLDYDSLEDMTDIIIPPKTRAAYGQPKKNKYQYIDVEELGNYKMFLEKKGL